MAPNVRRKKPPRINKESFPDETAARARVAELLQKIPTDELAFSLLPPLAPAPAPEQLRLDTAWPERRR